MRGVMRGGKQPPAVGPNSYGGVHLVLRRFCRATSPFAWISATSGVRNRSWVISVSRRDPARNFLNGRSPDLTCRGHVYSNSCPGDLDIWTSGFGQIQPSRALRLLADSLTAAPKAASDSSVRRLIGMFTLRLAIGFW
jgi:hypothetical protein